MYETYAFPAYVLVMLLLVVTIFIAPETKGSRSWLIFGPVSLQPAEFGKFVTALALAKLFSGYNFNLRASASNFGKALLIVLLPCVLVIAQKETGSALVYLSLFFVLYREGMSGLILFSALLAVIIFVVTIKYSASLTIGIPAGEFSIMVILMALAVGMAGVMTRNFAITRNILLGYAVMSALAIVLYQCGVEMSGYLFFSITLGGTILYCLFEYLRTRVTKLLVPIAVVVGSLIFMFSVNYVFNSVLKPYQQMRIMVTLGMQEDLQGAGYNVNQSLIAIGSGGATGKGFLKGTQTQLKYVPEQHTDFIFCTIGEEEGFVGTMTVILLFLMLILRVIYLAERQTDTFGRVYGYCVASYFIFHFCINLGMVMGLCPVIGIPLPFFSYGGSSLWGFTILLFILLKLDATRHQRANY